MLFSVEQAFVGREEIRAPLKTPAWEASERPTQGRGATFIITEMAVFTLEKDYSCETGYPFDDSRQIGDTS